jgi:hypothetical protein
MDKRVSNNAFNEAHPPFAESIEVMPPGRSEASVLGTAVIGKADFDRVRDPAYLWQDMPTQTPTERQRREEVKAAKAKQVESYLMHRERYWELIHRMQFAEDVAYEVSTSRGIETSHQETESQTSTETIGITLGLELSGSLFKPAAAKKAAAFQAAIRGTEAEAQGSAEFTYELSNELRFERVDSQTYTEEITVTTSTTYLGGHVYYVWSLAEALVMFRKRPELPLPEPMNDIVAATGTTWTDRLSYSTPPEGV